MSEAQEPRVVTVGRGRCDYVPGVSLEWLADADLTPGSGMTFGRAQFEPGSSNPEHYHPNCHELVFVAEGTIEHTLRDADRHAVRGIVVARAPGCAASGAINVGERHGDTAGGVFQRGAADGFSGRFGRLSRAGAHKGRPYRRRTRESVAAGPLTPTLSP